MIADYYLPRQLLVDYYRPMTNLDTLRSTVTAGLAVAGRQWVRLVEQSLESFDVSGPCALALVLIGRSAGIHQVALAEQLGVTGPTLVRQLDQLGDAGLVRREPDARNRRANTLWLTGTGQALSSQLEARLNALRQNVLEAVSREELAAVERVQQTIATAFGELEASRASTGKASS